jgi:hypothetical protein
MKVHTLVAFVGLGLLSTGCTAVAGGACGNNDPFSGAICLVALPGAIIETIASVGSGPVSGSGGYLRGLPLRDPAQEDRRRAALQIAGLPD